MGKPNSEPLWALLLLGGSWVVLSRVVSRVTLDLTYIGGRITPLITTHEPPSRPSKPSSHDVAFPAAPTSLHRDPKYPLN